MTGTASATPLPPPALEGGGRLYLGEVMHLRLEPRRHQFRARLVTMLLDLDRLPQTAARLRRFALDRRGPVGFRTRDHGPRDGTALRPWVEAQLARVEIAPPAHIGLLAMPRIWGFGFNPLSLYWCWDAQARVSAVVAQVKNTFGDQHAYVLRPADEGPILRDARTKHFFVSPFMDMDQRYRFELAEPGETLRIRIRQGPAEGPDRMIAVQTGAARPLTDARLARLAFAAPLHGLKPMAAIHWQALRLALKGVPFLGHPGDENVFAPGAAAPGG